MVPVNSGLHISFWNSVFLSSGVFFECRARNNFWALPGETQTSKTRSQAMPTVQEMFIRKPDKTDVFFLYQLQEPGMWFNVDQGWPSSVRLWLHFWLQENSPSEKTAGVPGFWAILLSRYIWIQQPLTCLCQEVRWRTAESMTWNSQHNPMWAFPVVNWLPASFVTLCSHVLCFHGEASISQSLLWECSLH